jgi:hypothetical protein
MAKLNRALAKHLTNDMSASDIKVNVGGDGAEVTAIVDDKFIQNIRNPMWWLCSMFTLPLQKFFYLAPRIFYKEVH